MSVDEKPLWAVPVVSVAAIFRRMQNDPRKQCGHVQKQLVVQLDWGYKNVYVDSYGSTYWFI